MAGSSLLALLDDITTLLDDIASMSKVAMKKTAGVLGDDLALNAQQVTGIHPDRELSVVWAVGVGSLKNKAILVPCALLISYFLPWAITPLLMLGGGFLCYEGFEKVWHLIFGKHKHQDTPTQKTTRLRRLADPEVDLVALEKERIQGAIRTDFILSAEIIVITLGLLTDSSMTIQVSVLIAVAVLITLVVYGLVAAIVKLDDFGVYLASDQGDDPWDPAKRGLGKSILVVAPYLMRLLSIAGTTAMFLVGGGIMVHSVHQIADVIHALEGKLEPSFSAVTWLVSILAEGLVGVITGGIVLGVVSLIPRKKTSSSEH